MQMREVRQKAQTEVNIKAEDGDRGAEDGDRSDLATIISDGGLFNPAFPSHDGIAPCGLSVSYSHTHRTPHSHTHSHTHSPPHSDTHSTPHSDTHRDTHSPPHSDTHSPPHSDTHSFPHSDINSHNDSHGNLIPCKMSFATQFIESSGNTCLKIQTDFEEAFVEDFPNIVVNEHSCNHEQLSKSKVTNKELIEDNATLFHEGNYEIMDTDIPVATQPSPLLWNANSIMFGSFHENDERFVDQSRGFKCTCNVLCMLVHDEIQSSSVLDQVLYDGEALYNSTVNKLKAEGKFVKSLLSLEEIPDTLEIKTGQYFVEKQLITCGRLVNTSEDEALPTLHCTLETAFLKYTSVLLIIGAVCSGSQSIRTQVNSYSFWSIRTQNFGQLVLIWSIRTHVWSVRTHFGQLVLILVNSYSNSNEYELTKMSTN